MKQEQREAYQRLAAFLVRFLPKDIQRYGFTRNYTQVYNQLVASHMLSREGKVNIDRLYRHMQHYYNVKMPKALADQDLWDDVTEEGSP